MKTKHTPGNWSHLNTFNGDWITNKKGYIVAALRADDGSTFDGIEPGETDANAKLIAAAPLGLMTAIKAYVAILQTPANNEAWRIQNQDLYCSLRDYISEATGYSSKQVQEFYEQVAFLIKYNGLSFDQAINQVSR